MKGITRDNWKITENNYKKITRRCNTSRRVNGKTFKIAGYITENIECNRMNSRITITTPRQIYTYTSMKNHIYTIMDDFASMYENVLRREGEIK